MMDKSPSDGFTLEELRSEYDWMFEFQSRMAEYIRGDADVHSLAGYVSKLESENTRLRQQLADMTESMGRVEERCAKLRDALKELVVGTHAEMCADRGMWRCRECVMYHGDESCAVADAMELLGIDTYGEPMEIEVDE